MICMYSAFVEEETTKPNVDREQISPQSSNVTLVSIETEFNELAASYMVTFSNTITSIDVNFVPGLLFE